jgi:hypothetical protein
LHASSIRMRGKSFLFGCHYTLSIAGDTENRKMFWLLKLKLLLSIYKSGDFLEKVFMMSMCLREKSYNLGFMIPKKPSPQSSFGKIVEFISY